MKSAVIGMDGKKGKDVSLPIQFSEDFRPDLIKKAVLAQQSHSIQPTGTSPLAGLRQSSFITKRRKHYKTTYGRGQSRTPRKILSRKGMNFHYVGAVAPNTVGGRVSHPPKASKIWDLKMNVQERRKAIRSAIAATMNPELVKRRGHTAESFVVEQKIEDLKKAKDVYEFLAKAGLEKELKRIAEKKIRAGIGKTRGRPYRKKKGPLFVVSKKCALLTAARNLQGIEVCIVKNLNAELLAPGTNAGRLTVWSDKALDVMDKEKLFFASVKKESKK
ncbi:50S ribosomal protein L4 [Candidatus Woesearchaeota archaeon]|nr:50S ribosomal protein L4 [Candidatus Woesearchaeota archaeon]